MVSLFSPKPFNNYVRNIEAVYGAINLIAYQVESVFKILDTIGRQCQAIIFHLDSLSGVFVWTVAVSTLNDCRYQCRSVEFAITLTAASVSLGSCPCLILIQYCTVLGEQWAVVQLIGV